MGKVEIKIMIIVETMKDGKNLIVLKWKIDESKPKCYRDGNSYKFNSELIGAKNKLYVEENM